jgi:hypothetical protein
MAGSVIQTSFGAGEVSRSLYGRVDLNKYKAGAGRLKNLIVDYRGGAANRPGLAYVGRCKDSTTDVKLIPFQFSTEQAYMLEFGNLYMRVMIDGAYVTETATNITGITQANPGVVTSVAHGYTTGDWVYLTAIGGMTQLNGRTVRVGTTTANTYQLLDLSGNNINTTGYGAYTAGGTAARIYTLVTPYTASEISNIKYTQSADVLTLTTPDRYPRDITRTAHAAWTITLVFFEPALNPPTSLSVAPSAAGAVVYGYRVTAVDSEGNESLFITGAASGADITAGAENVFLYWDQVPGAEYYNVYKANPIRGTYTLSAFPPQGTDYGFMTQVRGQQAVDTNIVPDFSKTPPVFRDPFAASQILAVTVGATGAGYAQDTTTITVGGAGTGAVIFPIVQSGGVQGAIIVNPGRDYTSVSLTVVGAGAGAVLTATVSPDDGCFPTCSAYFQQRKTFAASQNDPQAIWMTRTGLPHNMNVSLPVRDDDAIAITLNSLQVNAIKNLIPMPGGLLALTSDGVWQISGGGQNSPVTPSNILSTPQAYIGASDIKPAPVNYDVLYVEKTETIVRALNYNFGSNIYVSTDVSLLSNHLFTGKRVTNIAYAAEPFKLLWTSRDDGQFLSMTFLKDQEMAAWAQHATKGLVKDVASIATATEDHVYFVVRRFINGETVQFVERMASRQFENLEDAWFLDSAIQSVLTYPNATIQAAAAEGTNILVTATTGTPFVVGDVGKTLRVGGGIATVITYTSNTQIQVTFSKPISEVIPETETPLAQASGDWSMTANSSTFSNLWHLEGQTVKVFADGLVQADEIVANGSVTITTPASLVLIGLGYEAQLQTLPIELDGVSETTQGRRKNIPALTTRVYNTTGIEVGPTFDDLEAWAPNNQNFDGVESEDGMYSGDYRKTIGGEWTVPGQYCIQQSDPLPVNVLAVIPEMTQGDT